MTDLLVDAIRALEIGIAHLEAEFERTDDGGYYQDLLFCRGVLERLGAASTRAAAPPPKSDPGGVSGD